jgi:hypothetical protein
MIQSDYNWKFRERWKIRQPDVGCVGREIFSSNRCLSSSEVRELYKKENKKKKGE